MPKQQRRRTRGKGEGSIYQLPDGRWCGSVERPRGSDGRRRRTRIVRRRRQDVIDALPDLKTRAAGAPANGAITLGAYLDYWLTEVKAGEVSARSLNLYTDCAERITPHIGNVRLDRLVKGNVQTLSNRLAEKYAPKTCQTTLSVLRQALEWAIPDYLNNNPARHVRGPRQVARTDDALTAAESKAVLATAADDRHYALYWLALKYGLRISEVLGLRWSDIDLTADAPSLAVRKSKTAAGVRRVPLIDEAVAVLTAHRRRQGVMAIDGWVFTGPEGRPVSERQLRRWWSDLLAKAGVPHVCGARCTAEKCSTSVRRFHSSRHTAATLLLNAGVPIEVVSKILGHAKLAITSDLYARVQDDLMRKGLKTLG